MIVVLIVVIAFHSSYVTLGLPEFISSCLKQGYKNCHLGVLGGISHKAPCTVGFPGSASGKEPTCQCRRHKRDMGLILGLGRYPGGGYGKPPQYSCLENSHGQRSLAGYSHRGCKESDVTEQLSIAQPWVFRSPTFELNLEYRYIWNGERATQAKIKAISRGHLHEMRK